MGALPKTRISKSRQGKRRRHHVIAPVSLSDCPRCGAKKQSHHVCPECGTYNGVTVIEPRTRRAS